MKFKKYLNEMANYKTLLNMVSIVGNEKKDLDNANSTLDKALKKKLITDKEYKRLKKELRR